MKRTIGESEHFRIILFANNPASEVFSLSIALSDVTALLLPNQKLFGSNSSQSEAFWFYELPIRRHSAHLHTGKFLELDLLRSEVFLLVNMFIEPLRS